MFFAIAESYISPGSGCSFSLCLAHEKASALLEYGHVIANRLGLDKERSGNHTPSLDILRISLRLLSSVQVRARIRRGGSRRK